MTTRLLEAEEREPLRAALCTETGSRLHIAPCPYLGEGAREATTTELLAKSVCRWCQAEIDGVVRTYFDDLDGAMRFFGSHLGARSRVRKALRFLDYDQIWVPNSRSYIALGRSGHGVAWVGKTYIVPSVGSLLPLAGYAPHSGGGAERQERLGSVCERHFVVRGLNGACDLCN